MSENWSALARAVAGRRARLGIAQDELVTYGGPSAATLRLVERGGGTNLRALTFDRLDHALRWTPGVSRRVLHHEVDADAAVAADLEDAPAAAAATVLTDALAGLADLRPQTDATRRAQRLIRQLVHEMTDRTATLST
ncbi:hypothetical protein GCM10009836_72980 [Pseudonocardia ailaonensis]|uniref:XRE family transcriptional regulator n=1 Tax=Pseudonocardia ailaonensis TaxID=367279 RepID=A0ABN2NQ68_9PSEU